MSEHHDEQPSEGHSVVSSSSVVALAQRFVIKAVESSGHEEAARWLRQWPELLGDKAGQGVKKLFAKKAQGENITEKDKEELSEALKANPTEAAAVVGVLTTDLLEGTLDAASEREAILNTYKSSLEVICAYMAKATTSVALSGFLHEPNCISYWQFERKNLEFGSLGDFLYPNGLQIYFLYEEPTEERILQLNMLIRDDANRHLTLELYDFQSNDRVAKLEKIEETRVITKRLRPDRANLPKPKRVGGLRHGTDYDEPVEESSWINPGKSTLSALIESLQVAKEAQTYRHKELQNDARNAAQKKAGA